MPSPHGDGGLIVASLPDTGDRAKFYAGGFRESLGFGVIFSENITLLGQVPAFDRPGIIGPEITTSARPAEIVIGAGTF